MFSMPFLMIFYATFIVSIYGTFLNLNFKIYGLTKINNDKFLTEIAGINVLCGAISSIFWGILID